MKIKDVIQEGFWSSLGRGVAQGLGVTDSNVGKNAEQSLRSQADLQTRAKLPALAQQEFNKLLANSGIKLADPSTYDKDHLAQQLKAFAVHYFATGLPNEVAQEVENNINAFPFPPTLTDASVRNFLITANEQRSSAIDSAASGPTISGHAPPAPTPPAPTPTPPRGPAVTPGGVTIVRTSTGPGVPTHVRYRSQDFILVELPTGAEQWQNMMNGRPVPPTLAAFLTNELATT